MNSPRPRLVRRAVHGVLLLDKGLGVSSNMALQLAKRLFRAEKAGHTGTLDPLATGLLPLCFGAATKFAQVSLDADKRYLATLKLGVTTTSGDAEGEVVRERPVAVSRPQVEAACAGFVGAISQLPPMHSALKHEGKPLYDYARAGIEIEREPRNVTIHAIDVVEGEGDRWMLDVRCSKGTYIRTLAEDIGEALGCGAHLAALRRTGSGRLGIESALTIEALEALSPAELDGALLPVEALVADWPKVVLLAEDAGRFLAGVRRRLPLADAANVRVYGPGAAFLGSAHVAGGELIASRLLSPAEVGAAIPAPMPRPRIEESESLPS
ncbi:MAG: tRNA pseudouridine(55) synthase TruB [Burkholderiales bacterium]|nr:tRNA pseudouridine(55) synthase TruB [Burkholderiales bacterium]